MKPSRFFELLEVLTHHSVNYIVVGGVAAIVEGAPVTTLDLDIVIDHDIKNLESVLEALHSINAHYRDLAGRHITPTRERLTTNMTNLMQTDLGPLDVLVEIGDGERYAELLPHTRVREVAGIKVQVLGLEKVIETKEAADRDKDRAVLPVLRRSLELKRKQQGRDRE